MSLRLVVVVLVLLSALALGGIAWRASQPVPQILAHAPEQAPAPLTFNYLVTAHALPAGTLTRDSDWTIHTVPAAKLPEHAIIDTPTARATLRGALVRRYLDAGVPIFESDILRPRDRGFLAAVLAPGTRALSIGVDAVSGVAGLIWPGDKVDVILTQEMAHNATPGKSILGETVLRDVRVIAVDQQIVQGASADANVAGRLARTVTLQVTSEDAEKLAVAQRLGRLELAIRSATEGRPGYGEGTGTMYGADVSPALAAAGKAVPSTASHMLVIEGSQRSEFTFR